VVTTTFADKAFTGGPNGDIERKFIGKRGASIRSLQDQTGTIIYNKGRRTDNTFMVFYHKPEALMKVQQKARS